jgi:hypothetical protein
MARYYNIQSVSMAGATTNISQYTEVVRITGTNGSGNTFVLPQVTASDSLIGYDYTIFIVDTGAYFTTSTAITIQPNGSDTGYEINGSSSWTNPTDKPVIVISYTGDGKWTIIKNVPKNGYILNISNGIQAVLTSISSGNDYEADADSAYLYWILGDSLIQENETQLAHDPGGYMFQGLTGTPSAQTTQDVDGVIYNTVTFETSSSGSYYFDYNIPNAGDQWYVGIEILWSSSSGTIVSSGGTCDVGEFAASVISTGSGVVIEDYDIFVQWDGSGASQSINWSVTTNGSYVRLTATQASSNTHHVTALIRLYTIEY